MSNIFRAPFRARRSPGRDSRSTRAHAASSRAPLAAYRNFPAAAARIVNGGNELESAIAVFAGGQRLAVLAYGVAELAKLALERNQRNGHRIGGAAGNIAFDGRALAAVVLDIPNGEFVARDNRRSFRAMDLEAFGVAGPERRGCLHNAGGPVCVPEHGVDDILGLDLMQRAELPIPEQLRNSADEIQQHVDLVNRRVDERAAAFRFPTAFDRTRVVSRRAIPLHIGIGLQNFSEPAGRNGAFEELDRIVEAMLADDVEFDSSPVGYVDHFARCFQIGRDGLLYLDVLARIGADLQRLQPKIREGTHVDIIDVRMAA